MKFIHFLLLASSHLLQTSNGVDSSPSREDTSLIHKQDDHLSRAQISDHYDALDIEQHSAATAIEESYAQEDSNTSTRTERGKKISKTITLKATDDVVIRFKQKNKNYNSNILRYSNRPVTKSLLRFQITNEILNNIVSLETATLKLYTLSPFKGELTIHALSGNWNENKATWNNAPSTTGPVNTKKIMTRKAPIKSWYVVDVTNAVKWSVNRGQNYVTLRVSTKKRVGGRFASRDYKKGRYAPHVVVKLNGVGGGGGGGDGAPKPATKRPTSRPTMRPNKPPATKPQPKPPAPPASSPTTTAITYSPSTATKVLSLLSSKKQLINTQLLFIDTHTNPVYVYDGLAQGLKVMNSKGVAGKKYYLGDDSRNGKLYGLVNVAAFLAQSMKETIKYNACDENNWVRLESLSIPVRRNLSIYISHTSFLLVSFNNPGSRRWRHIRNLQLLRPTRPILPRLSLSTGRKAHGVSCRQEYED
jgi:hypothetical protein